MYCQNNLVQLRGEDGITPLWNQVACLLESYWFKQENRLWRQLGCVWVCPMSNPKPSCFDSLTHSILEALVSGYHYQKKGKISNLQKAPHPPLLLNAICKMYFTLLWIAAVLNNSIWKFVKRTADAEQQLGRFYIVQGLRSPVSRVSGSGEHPRVIHGASAVRKFLSRILYKNRCWPNSYLCLQDRLLSNNLSRLKAWRR